MDTESAIHVILFYSPTLIPPPPPVLLMVLSVDFIFSSYCQQSSKWACSLDLSDSVARAWI